MLQAPFLVTRRNDGKPIENNGKQWIDTINANDVTGTSLATRRPDGDYGQPEKKQAGFKELYIDDSMVIGKNIHIGDW